MDTTKQVLQEQKEEIDFLNERVEALEEFIWVLIEKLGCPPSEPGELQHQLEQAYTEAQEKGK
ncbi:MAG TPA: hypothetical protein VN922_08010 [Bacteroidia bacterium]|nr:hypothetical protein [Bacteroidia bacterium]